MAKGGRQHRQPNLGRSGRPLYERPPGGYASREGCVVELRVDLGLDRDQDASELDEDTFALRHELLQLDVDDVQRVEGARLRPVRVRLRLRC